MTKLSTAQVAALEAVAFFTGRNSPFIPPTGPRGRPYKFLKNAELIEERTGNVGAVWITATGTAELERQKGGSPS